MAIISSYTHPYATKDLYTICNVDWCQHHDEPLAHSRNSQNKEYVQSEDRKRSMNSNSGTLQRPDMKHSIHLQITKLVASKTVALMLNAASWIEDLPCRQIDFFAHRGKNKSKVFLSQDLQGYSTIPCKGTQKSKRFHPKHPLRLMALHYAGLRQRSRDSRIESLQRSETLHTAGSRQSDKSHSYRSEGLPRSKTLNFVSQPTVDISHFDLMRSKTFQYESLQTSDEPYSHMFNNLTHPPVEGTRGAKLVIQNALQALILQILMLLRIAGTYLHVVILMVFITQAACAGVQIHINCRSASVILSPNYPSTYPQYENKNWFFTAPEGRRILLTFNNFSLGPSDKVIVINTVDDGYQKHYSGEGITLPSFLSRRNSLVLRFASDGNPIGKGFNISASCYELSGTRVGRLVGGNTPAEGFLELQAESGGEWMRVCEESSADRLAEVVCGELGFPGAKKVSNEKGVCSSEGADPDCIRAPSCGNDAYRSQDCSASSEKCTSTRAVKVKCFEPGFKGCYDLRNTQLQNGYSHNSTSQCVTSCKGDTPQAIAIINGSECFCSTTDDIRLPATSYVEDQSCALHQLVYNASFGFCNQADDVMNGSWDSDDTWFGSIINLMCDEGYRLTGRGTLQCLTEVSTYLHVWQGCIPTCEIVAVTAGPATTQDSTPHLVSQTTHSQENKNM